MMQTSMIETVQDFQLAKLLTANAFPHPISELKVRETHISWIVLTGQFAYKIKKPVRFDFIDCSSLDTRRRLCEEELRLNRRLAPGLYVDTVPITRCNGGLQIGGSGPVAEYAVRMRQFDSAAELPQLLSTGRITTTQITALAELLARFHMQAPVVASSDCDSGQQAVDAILGNVSALCDALESTPLAPAVRRIAHWCHEQVRALAPALEMRSKNGFVRECHGDLHAANIVRYESSLVPFDCIEFAPKLRQIDVIDDLGFLVMDLRSRGRTDLAMVLLSRYLEITGDYEGVSLLQLYCVHRALVRAKVDALTLDQQDTCAEDLQARLAHRLDSATEWTRTHPSMLVLMHGPSGSGKSWLSAQLVAALPAVRIRSDVERKRLAGLVPLTAAAAAPQQGLYTAQFNHRTYARLTDCADACLRAGVNVIIDAASLDPTDREVFQRLARTLEVGFAIIACQADPIELASRILQRGREHTDPSDASLAVLDAQLRNLQPFTESERLHVIAVDTARDVDVAGVARAVAAHVGVAQRP